MKKHITLLVCFLFITVSAVTFTACDSTRPKLIGIWVQQNYEGMTWKKPRIEFNDDETFRLQTPLGQTSTGTWQLGANDTIKLHYSENDMTLDIEIVELRDDSMTTVTRGARQQYKKVQSWTAET